MSYKQALILIDIQNDYFFNGKLPLVGIDEAAETAAKLLEKARGSSDTFIIFVKHEDENKDSFLVKGTSGSEINDVVKPNSDELIITKKYPNSFLETTLQEVLIKNKIKDLIIVGAMTHICVQGTTRAAHELGYRNKVIKDAVATRDLTFDGVTVPAKHVQATILATLLQGGYAEIIDSASIKF